MKPSWDDAPEWARFCARDTGGWWHWFERKPRYVQVGETSTPGAIFGFWCNDSGRAELAQEDDDCDTLEERP